MSTLTDRTVSARRIKAVVFAPMSDALRNHLVTLTYVDLGTAMGELLGTEDANWTSLAVWPSFTVGETIRATDDPLGLKRMLGLAKSDPLGLARSATTSRVLRGGKSGGRVLNRSLAAGNRGVFLEIGLCWADFVTTFRKDMPDDEIVTEFAKFLERIDRVPTPPGKLWPEGNRDQLKKGFAAYIEAMGTDDPKTKAELILLGNMCMGDHEQRRLQGWLDLSMLNPVRVLTKPIRNVRSGEFVGTVEKGWAKALTRKVFVVTVGKETVRVGKPVPPLHDAQYPAPLDSLEHPGVRSEFERIANEGTGASEGAQHWNDINDRMSFIASLFRARQRAGLVGLSPYTTEQEATIWAAAAEVDAQDEKYEFEGPLLFPKAETAPWPPEVVRGFIDRLEEGRQRCDAPVDNAIEAFYQASGIDRRDRHFTDVMMAIADPSAPRDTAIARFLDEDVPLPSWADLDRLRRAQQFFETFRPMVHASLFFGSMFLGYAAGNGVQVLALVSDLTKSPERRIWESTRFVEDICTTPFWQKGTAGAKSIRGVRVFHGSMRATIESGSQHIKSVAEYETDRVWDRNWGRPINQEDMFGYCLTMAVPTIENLDRMGVAIDPETVLDWLHLWNVVGVLMGVEESYVVSPLSPVDAPRDLSFEEARYAHDIVLSRNVKPTPQGRQLTAVLLDQMGWFPGPMRRVARSFIRSSIGDQNADMLGIPKAGLLEPMISGAQNAARTLRQNSVAAAGSREMGTWLGHQFLEWWEKEYRAIPPYRQGGVEAVADRAPDPRTRLPRTVSISIETIGELPQDVSDAIASVPGVSVSVTPHADDDEDEYEKVAMETLLAGTVAAGPAVGQLVTAVRNATKDQPSVGLVSLVIDGRTVPLSQLSDEEIEQLLPELNA